jgi:ABC-type transporter Mla MlaB component
MKKKSGKPAAELQPGVLSLPGSVAIRNARELREHWLTHVSSPALQVDASAVSDVDTAGLQLLLAWKRAVAAGGGKFEWSQVSLRYGMRRPQWDSVVSSDYRVRRERALNADLETAAR